MMSLHALIKYLSEAGIYERADPKIIEEGLVNLPELLRVPRTNLHSAMNHAAWYNALGTLYKPSNLEIRARIVTTIGENILPRQDRDIRFIREPLLFGNLVEKHHVESPTYTKQIQWRASNYADFETLKRLIILENGTFNPKEVENDFLTAYAILRRDEFVKDYVAIAHPAFLKRVVKGIGKICPIDGEIFKKYVEKKK